MIKRCAIILGLCLFTAANAAPLNCDKSKVPTVIKPMENWDIIATNTGTIDMGKVFSGDKLSYTIKTHPKNSQNKVTINKATGVIKVKAEKKDDFDITVKAKNACGEVSNKFNVVIDEEE